MRTVSKPVRESRDSIADIWGERTPHQGEWPERVDERDDERQQQEREEQLPGAPGGGHSGHQRPHGADAEVREQHTREGGPVEQEEARHRVRIVAARVARDDRRDRRGSRGSPPRLTAP